MAPEGIGEVFSPASYEHSQPMLLRLWRLKACCGLFQNEASLGF